MSDALAVGYLASTGSGLTCVIAVQADRFSDALVVGYLAGSGSGLWQKALDAYMKRAPRPYMAVVKAATTNDFSGARCCLWL
jgi:hypothetical protein